METLRKYWAQLLFVISVIVGGTILKTEFEISKATQASILKELKDIKENNLMLIEKAVETLNEEDDGVRSDFEINDTHIRGYEDLREEKLYYKIMYEIEKNKK